MGLHLRPPLGRLVAVRGQPPRDVLALLLVGAAQEVRHLARLAEEHDVEVAHLVPGRGPDVGGVVHPRAVVGAPGGQDVVPGPHRLHLLHGVEGLGPLRAAARDLAVLVARLVVHVAGDHGGERVRVGAVGEQVQRHGARHAAVDVPVDGGRVGGDVEVGAQHEQDARLVPGRGGRVAQAQRRVVGLRDLVRVMNLDTFQWIHII